LDFAGSLQISNWLRIGLHLPQVAYHYRRAAAILSALAVLPIALQTALADRKKERKKERKKGRQTDRQIDR
jgi:hypothetical protein